MVKFFLPFWWDHVYKNFNEWKDTWTNEKEQYQFLWEIGKIPFDGLLFSRVKIESSKLQVKKITESGGLRNHLKIPDSLPLFGDCGAFGYINEDVPPFDPLETLDYYKRMGFNLACTLDHLIVASTDDQKHKRQELCLDNAEKMMDRWVGKYDYDLLGVAQGWDPESYKESVKGLLEMGFFHLAIGGLVRTQSKEIIKVLKEVAPLWRDKPVQVHLFGVARWPLMPFLRRSGITSFDNARHRRAWLSGKNNYETPDGGYTAVRIPLSDRQNKTRTIAERVVFDKLKDYIDGKLQPEQVVGALKTYELMLVRLGKEDKHRFDRLKDLEKEYLRTLRDKPWESCDCPVCKRYGVHVCVFRTNERNMRRGYHNLYTFFNRLCEWRKDNGTPQIVESIPDDLENVLVITSCTSAKLGQTEETIARARDMYKGRMFTLTRELCEKNKWDYVIISAKYGALNPDEEIKGYDQFLQTKEDIESIKPLVINRLKTALYDYDRVLVLAGKNYRSVIKSVIDDRFIFIKSKGYGDLCSKIKKAIPNGRTLLDY